MSLLIIWERIQFFFFLFLIIIELGWVLFAVSGAACASLLARNGVSVTLFESARGPGGRMSYRK